MSHPTATRPGAGAPDLAPDAPPEAVAAALFEAEAAALPRRPSATYRLQLHAGFRLDDVGAIAGYLRRLGISDVYLSPYLSARPGSTHGYDVFDHSTINREIGDADAHGRLVDHLAELGMGRVLDIVPNHMGVGDRNRYWGDVLEAGPQSPSSRFFDIDWLPVKEELEGRVLLPILEDQYGKVLEQGKLTLERDGGAFFIRYHDHRLPLAPKSYANVMEQRALELMTRFDPADEDVLEYRSILASARYLPERHLVDPQSIEHKLREKEVIKRRIARLCEASPAMREFLDANLAAFRGEPGNPESFDVLHHLLEEQAYRLAYWRVAAEEINFRRFFDINDLAGLRTEDPVVFDVIHHLILQWVEQGGVAALRIDHPDGLADPTGYFRRLQEQIFLRDCRRRLEAWDRGDLWWTVADGLLARFRDVLEGTPTAVLARRFPIVAEKILSTGEELPEAWPIDGTVGYEYLNALNGLFVESAAAPAIERAYTEFTGDREPFAEVLYRSKLLICRASLASEINMLARQINRVSERDRRSRDFTLNDLREGVRETIACFPVYRTYVRPGEEVSSRDRGYIEQAIARARRRNPTIDATLFEFLKAALLLEHPEGSTADDRTMREAFVVRFQQTTGPVQAKGLEDTTFYRQVKLGALNEVGGDPTRFGTPPAAFHALNRQRLADWPGGLSTTATHDTKRGEDVRPRIDALSELATEWDAHLCRWGERNAKKKVEVHGEIAPDPREEYLFYQTLLGAWPAGEVNEATPEFVGRIQQYMLKAIREAKVNTSWTDPDPSYAEAVTSFVADVLTGPGSDAFLADFLPFQRRLSRIGMVHSLAQALLKVASPGVPDVYQGCDLWDYNLVDPDNRRPVDYDLRARLLDGFRHAIDSGRPRGEVARDLLAKPDDGAIKLYLLWTALNHRRDHADLYARGTYDPIDADGPHAGRVVAFARRHEGTSVLIVAPRLVAPLMGDDARTMPVGPSVWSDTRLALPDAGFPTRWRDLLTDRALTARDGRLPLGEVFATLPVALLEG